MKANTFPLNDGGNAAAARKESVDGPSSFPRANPSDRSNGPARRDERVKATSPITGSGSVQTHKLPRNLPKLDARNMPSLTQLGPVRRMPGAMAATSNLGIVRPRKLAPLKLTHADKGKQFFNAAMNEASLEPTDADKGKQLLNAATTLHEESQKMKKKKHHHHHHHHKKSKKRKHKKRRRIIIDGENDAKDLPEDPTDEAAAQDPTEEAAAEAREYLCKLLDTKKGSDFLMQETTISKAFREGNLVDLYFERKNVSQSLGIGFDIPARVSVMDWMSQQRLIVSNIKKGSPAEGAKMEIDDIVARIDDHNCQSIGGFKEDINGKSNFTITVARCKGVNVEDIRKVRKDIEVQVMETARQRVREMQTHEEA